MGYEARLPSLLAVLERSAVPALVVGAGRCSASSQQAVVWPWDGLKSLLSELGIKEFAGCGCDANAAQMNAWGIDGCNTHFAAIREWLVEAQAKAPWFDKSRAAVNVARGGLRIDLADIAGSLVTIAIQSASNRSSATL